MHSNCKCILLTVIWKLLNLQMSVIKIINNKLEFVCPLLDDKITWSKCFPYHCGSLRSVHNTEPTILFSSLRLRTEQWDNKDTKNSPFPMVFDLPRGLVAPLTLSGFGDKDCEAKTTFWNSEFSQYCYDHNSRCHEHRHQGTLSSPPIISNSLALQLDRAGSFR